MIAINQLQRVLDRIVYAIVLILLVLQGLSDDGHGMDPDQTLKFARKSWERQRLWNGPDAKLLKWKTVGRSNVSQRVVEGGYYRRSFVDSSGKVESIAIRNPEYAAWLEKFEDHWLLKDIAYRGDRAYDRYTREVQSPWVMPHTLPKVGWFSEGIELGQLSVIDIQQVDGEAQNYRFVLSEASPEAEKLMSIIEVDASPNNDWFPTRLYWILRKSGKSYTYRVTKLTKIDGFFVPEAVDSWEGADTQNMSTVELTGVEDHRLDPTMCLLDYYGLGALQLPKEQPSRFQGVWLLSAGIVVFVVAGLLMWRRVKSR